MGKLSRAEQERAAATPEWITRRRELLSQYPRCEYCNGNSQVANHKYNSTGYLRGYENYRACNREEIDVICNPCHQHYTMSGGKKRKRCFNDCSKCGKAAEIPATICINCKGGNVIDRCPPVRIGDVWGKVWLWTVDVKVSGFEKQSLPWVMVKTDRGDVGLPAFITESPGGATWAILRKSGRGMTWQTWLSKR